MVCKVSIADGKVHFCSRFVASEHRREEEEAKKFIYPGQMGTRNDNKVADTVGAFSSVLLGRKNKFKFRNPSNTNAFYWGGKVISTVLLLNILL